MAAVAKRATETEHNGAFVVGPGQVAAGASDGPLAGLTFVVKDMIDVAGYRTGAGNPDLAAATAPAEEHAAAVRRLLDCGASCIGKVHTAESAYSLSGVNEHYGTPRHPLDPALDPGGSSSGAAVAVAAR
ncbi:MAG: amidase, partial [Acidimicrobiia bacterium]|nr:amidase [Acidimicrobiia bacterium]